MTDETFINYYLDKHFYLKLDGSGYLFIMKETGRGISRNEFDTYILKVLTNYRVDAKTLMYDLCERWFQKNRFTKTKPLEDYLSDCILRLTRFEWLITKPSGEVVNIDLIYNQFEEKYSKQFLLHFFIDWRTDRICQESERIMNL